MTPFLGFRKSSRPRQRGVLGSASKDPRLPAASITTELFISNVRRGTTVSDIADFLRPKVDVLNLCLISHPDARTQSYLLTISPDLADYVLCSDFWPLGICCRKFVRPISGRLASIRKGAEID